MKRLTLLRMAFLAAAVSVAATACGDDDDSDGNRTGGAGGKGGSSASGGKGGTAGSQSSGGEGGDGTTDGGTSASGGSGGDAGETGSAGAGDAGGGNEGGGDGTGNDCSVEEDYGDAGNVPGTAYTDLDATIAWFGALEQGDPADGLWIELHDEWGVFENGITTLDNHILEGDDLAPDTCGACIYIADRQNLNDPYDWEDTYFLTGGTLTLTSVEGNITGTLTNATFKKIDWDTEEWIEDGCETKIESISFDAALPDEE